MFSNHGSVAISSLYISMGSISSLGSSVPWNDVRDSGPGPCSSSRPAAEILSAAGEREAK